VWKGEGILLDGHNRYEICTQNNLAFDIEYVKLPDRNAALSWIVSNQLGRRNLTPEQTLYYLGKKYNLEKTAGHGAKSGGQNDPQKHKTADRLAAQHKVSGKTIKRGGKYAEAVDAVAGAVGKEAREKILSRNGKLTSGEVSKLADVAKQDKAAAKERQGERTDKHRGKLPPSSQGKTRDKVARYVGVSGRTMEKAALVLPMPISGPNTGKTAYDYACTWP